MYIDITSIHVSSFFRSFLWNHAGQSLCQPVCLHSVILQTANNWLFTLQYKTYHITITKNIVSMLKLSSGVFVLFTLTTSWKPHYNFKSYAYFIWQLLVYEIQYGKDERAYLTQGWETGYKDDVLQINGIYASKLGIKEEDVCILNKYWYKVKHSYICFFLIRVTAVMEGSCCWYNFIGGVMFSMLTLAP